MCILNQLGRHYPSLQWLSRIGLTILFPLSLWVALMPIDHYLPNVAFSDKILHFLVFLGFSILLYIALHPAHVSGDKYGSYKRAGYQQGLPLIGYGVLIEILQSFTSYRSFSLWDALADALGVMAFWIVLILYQRQRKTKLHTNCVDNQ